MTELPLVTIRCITYNHEPYIRECLKGFVMQKTNFKFEAIVHNDASTDRTADIIREYAEKYPDIIKPIYQTENQYSKIGFGGISKILDKNTRGKYVALCEGDDYWTDEYKLQTQVDFLEENGDFSMCFHSAKIIPSGCYLDGKYGNVTQREYTADEILKNWIIPTASVVYKAEINKLHIVNNNFKVGDNVLFALCATCGKIMGLEDYMSIYRVTTTGAVSNLTPEIQATHWIAMLDSFPMFYKTIKDNIISWGIVAIKNNIKLFKIHTACVIFGNIGSKLGYIYFSKKLIYWTIGIKLKR